MTWLDSEQIVSYESGFGRINKPKYCWCEKGIRPSVPCHHIREYRYAYGAVEPLTGEGCFLILPYCNTACMNLIDFHAFNMENIDIGDAFQYNQTPAPGGGCT